MYTKPCICRFPGQGFSSSTKQRQKAAIPEAPSHTVMRELQCNLSVHPVRAAVRIQPHGAERRRKQKPNPKPEVHNLSVQRAGGVCKGLAGLGGNGEVDQCALQPNSAIPIQRTRRVELRRPFPSLEPPAVRIDDLASSMMPGAACGALPGFPTPLGPPTQHLGPRQDTGA